MIPAMTDSPDITPLQRIVYDLVMEIIEIKTGAVEPCVAHIKEIRQSLSVEVLEASRGLCRAGVLSASLDVNKNPMFRIKHKLQ